MPAAYRYSYDLRKKQWRLWTQGASRAVVAKRFKIGETTLYEWQVRRKETGVLHRKSREV
ncbi:IS630 transposase-related protein [Wolbachia endosymbiont (group E) of Neria commutata]|uniref:IS630 transposase-related protein n=1 Tax=Wolbachia endosymbiont (group E) of Neria commutata TaxID=3066149 RepID=UPI00397D3FB1